MNTNFDSVRRWNESAARERAEQALSRAKREWPETALVEVIDGTSHYFGYKGRVQSLSHSGTFLHINVAITTTPDGHGTLTEADFLPFQLKRLDRPETAPPEYWEIG